MGRKVGTPERERSGGARATTLIVNVKDSNGDGRDVDARAFEAVYGSLRFVVNNETRSSNGGGGRGAGVSLDDLDARRRAAALDVLHDDFRRRARRRSKRRRSKRSTRRASTRRRRGVSRPRPPRRLRGGSDSFERNAKVVTLLRSASGRCVDLATSRRPTGSLAHSSRKRQIRAARDGGDTARAARGCGCGSRHPRGDDLDVFIRRRPPRPSRIRARVRARRLRACVLRRIIRRGCPRRSSVRDPRALVARFRAVNDARETLAPSPPRLRCATRAPAPGPSILLGDARISPAYARRPRLSSARPMPYGARTRRSLATPGAPAHDRFTTSLAARIRAECDRLRAVATRLAVDAAGRTGQPPQSAQARWTRSVARRPLVRQSAADLCDACAVLGARHAAEENTAKLDGDGIEPATLFESWIADALASPVRDAVERHFVVDASSPANDPSRPERLFACVTRVAARCAPRRAALRHGIEPATFESRAGGSDAGIRSKASVQRLATGFAVALARIARDVVEGHFIPATETAETEEGYVGARAYSRENSRASDARWLHLADECERFDVEVRALVTRLSSNPKVGRSIPTGPSELPRRGLAPRGCSSLAALASSGRDRAVRWMRAELTDCLREIDVVAADTNAGTTNDSWSPAGIARSGLGTRRRSRPVARRGGIEPATFGFRFGRRHRAARRGEGGGVFQPSRGPSLVAPEGNLRP